MMARIRSVHPGLFTDEAFAALTCDAQMFFIGLWTEADDQGVFEWKPLTLRMRLRPTKDGAVDGLLSELANGNCIRKYEINGRQYGAIRNFRRYQRPKSPNSVHPITHDVGNYVGLSNSISEIDKSEPQPFPQIGEIGPQMEDGGGRMEDGGDTTRALPLAREASFIDFPTNRKDEVFGLSAILVVEYEQLYPAVNVPEQLRKMRAWLLSNPTKRKTRSGMTKFINSWLSRQQDEGSKNGPSARASVSRPSAHDSFLAGGAAFLRELDGSEDGIPSEGAGH